MIKIEDTIVGMTSPDYKFRFQAEYWQTKIRYEKLKAMLTKWDALKKKYAWNLGDYILKTHLGFVPTCPYEMLREQQRQMGEYLHSLEMRAVLEDIDLDEAVFYTKAE